MHLDEVDVVDPHPDGIRWDGLDGSDVRLGRALRREVGDADVWAETLWVVGGLVVSEHVADRGVGDPS